MSPHSSTQPDRAAPPRMLNWLWITIVLAIAAQGAMRADAGSLFAVTLYKAHLLSLGGWGGYWLDRALFPYARPHEYVEDELTAIEGEPIGGLAQGEVLAVGAAYDYPLTMLRRAVIVAACLICVGLGA